LEDADFDGYNIRRAATTNNNVDFGFERRNNGSGGGYQASSMNQPRNNWYRTELTRCYKNQTNLTNDETTARLYNDSNTLIGSVTGSDNNYTAFDRVTVRGGRPYYMDFMAVGKFTCDEPKVNIKNAELDIPMISCTDITVSVDENGKYILDPAAMIESATDCNALEYIANQTDFDCDDLGTHKIKILATDPCGNTSDCSAKLTLVDELAPKIECPGDISIVANQANCQALVTWQAPSYSDNCEVATVFSSHASGSLFDLGESEVKYVITDDSGNQANCSFFVKVTSSASTPEIKITETSGPINNDGVLCTGDEFCLTVTEVYAGYSWSNSESGNPMCSTVAGEYSVVVKDQYSCSATSEIITIKNSPTLEAGTCNIVHDYCQSEDGQVRIQVNNGTPPYQINWSPTIDGANSGVINTNGNFIDIENIPGGTTINFSIIDDYGCTLN